MLVIESLKDGCFYGGYNGVPEKSILAVVDHILKYRNTHFVA